MERDFDSSKSLIDIILQIGYSHEKVYKVNDLIKAKKRMEAREACLLFLDGRFLDFYEHAEIIQSLTDIIDSQHSLKQVVITSYLARNGLHTTQTKIRKPFKLEEVYQILENIERDNELLERKCNLQLNTLENPAMHSLVEKVERILVVDDNPINQKVMAHVLKKLNYLYVDVASSGEEACIMEKKNSYRVIFMDLQMPGIDGFEASKLITDRQVQRYGHIKSKIVLLSAAHDTEGNSEKLLKHGMVANSLSKPISIPEIQQFLSSAFVK